MTDSNEAIVDTYQIKDRRFHEEVSAFTLKICTPIYWHDRDMPFPKEVRGASCFMLRFGEQIVGVTANHVIEEYKQALSCTPTLVCQLRMLPFNLEDAIIDADRELDIATFRLSKNQLSQIEGIAVDCTRQWPPPVPEHMRAISFAGFPEAIRRVNHLDRSAEFLAYGALTCVESISEREILTVYDPKIARQLAGCARMPPLRFNMSGCSGGPVLIHGERNGLHRWFPVGLIIAGPGMKSDGETQAFDMVRLRRIHFIQPDGRISHPSTGWLPV